LRLVEVDTGTAQEMAAGVSALLARFEVTTTVGDPVELLSTLQADELLLVAPRMWDRLPQSVRQDGRVLDVRYVIIPDELQRLWGSFTHQAHLASGVPSRLADRVSSHMKP
jgi:hypothetical protein